MRFNLLAGVIDFFYETVEEADAAATRRRYHWPGFYDRPPENSAIAFERRLVDIGRLGGRAPASMIEIINLEDLKSHYGNKWEAIAEHVRLLARKAITSRIGPEDRITSVDPDSFIILFATADKDEAEQIARAVAQEIYELLLSALGDDCPLHLQATLVEVVGQQAADGAPSLQRAEGPHRLDVERPSQVRRRRGSALRMLKTLLGGDDEPEPDSEPEEAPEGVTTAPAEGVQEPAWHWQDEEIVIGEGKTVLTVDSEKKAKEAVAAADATAEVSVKRHVTGQFRDIKVRFHPLLDLKSGIVRAFHAAPSRLDAETGRTLYGTELYSPNQDETGTLDEIVLYDSITHLDAMVADGRQAAVVVPLHFNVLHKPKSRKRIEAIVKTAKAQVSNILIIELVWEASSVTVPYLEEIQAFVARISPRMFLRLPAEAGRAEYMLKAHAAAVGTTLRDHSGREARFTPPVQRLPEAARLAGSRSYFLDVNSAATARAAHAAGFDLMCGDAIGAPVETPQSPYRIRSKMPTASP